jgi:GAF domain-containing protein
MRLRERIEEESDPCISFQLWWELDRLVPRDPSQPDPTLPLAERSASAHQAANNPYFAFKYSVQISALLLSTMEATGADFGCVQLFHASNRELKIVAQHGFGNEFLGYFDTVHDPNCACGEAMSRRSRVLVSDVASDPLFRNRQTQGVMRRAHVRSVQSTPLIYGSGELIGVVSTHFDRPRVFPLHLLERIDEIIASYMIPLQCPSSIDINEG